jgi:hypothetical protein
LDPVTCVGHRLTVLLCNALGETDQATLTNYKQI